MKLDTQNNLIDSWSDLKPNEYCLFTDSSGKLCGLAFKCPGCNGVLAVSEKTHRGDPGWNIDFEQLTARPSILHSRQGKGCGWHGYLTNGELKPC